VGVAGAAIGVGAAASLGGAVIQSGAAQSAAQTQAQAAEQAGNNTMAMFNQTNANLAPYRALGSQASNALGAALPSLTQTFNPTMAQLAQTPGYQFTLQQGEQATQNSYAAQGLGSSGSALKGASQYAEGLASTTYQQQFENYLQQNSQIYSLLSNATGIGANAAAMTGQQGLTATGQAGAFNTSGGAASAAGQVGSANAITGGISNVGGSLSSLGYLSALSGNNGLFGGNSGAGAASANDFSV
jgi:hypothetical protein